MNIASHWPYQFPIRISLGYLFVSFRLTASQQLARSVFGVSTTTMLLHICHILTLISLLSIFISQNLRSFVFILKLEKKFNITLLHTQCVTVVRPKIQLTYHSNEHLCEQPRSLRALRTSSIVLEAFGTRTAVKQFAILSHMSHLIVNTTSSQ